MAPDPAFVPNGCPFLCKNSSGGDPGPKGMAKAPITGAISIPEVQMKKFHVYRAASALSAVVAVVVASGAASKFF